MGKLFEIGFFLVYVTNYSFLFCGRWFYLNSIDIVNVCVLRSSPDGLQTSIENVFYPFIPFCHNFCYSSFLSLLLLICLLNSIYRFFSTDLILFSSSTTTKWNCRLKNKRKELNLKRKREESNRDKRSDQTLWSVWVLIRTL